MSRRNAKLAHIEDLQHKHGEATLTKKDLQWMVDGLRMLDKTNFTERDNREYTQLLQYLVNLKRG